jgi:hypothetical protein
LKVTKTSFVHEKQYRRPPQTVRNGIVDDTTRFFRSDLSRVSSILRIVLRASGDDRDGPRNDPIDDLRKSEIGLGQTGDRLDFQLLI